MFENATFYSLDAFDDLGDELDAFVCSGEGTVLQLCYVFVCKVLHQQQEAHRHIADNHNPSEHREKESCGQSCVDWHCEQVRKLPRRIHENLDVLRQDVNDLRLLLLLHLPLTQTTNEFEKPTLQLRLYEPEVIVNFEIIGAPCEDRH